MEQEENMKPIMRSIALSATSEFLMFIGVIFILWGISRFVTDFLGVEGTGEFLVGIFLLIVAFALLMRSKALMPKKMPKKKKEKEHLGDYR